MSSSAERIQEMMRKFEEQAKQVGQLQSAMQDMRGTAQSPDRSVNVSVAPSGAVIDLQLNASAMKLSHTQLQQAIMGAIRSATQDAAGQLNETVAPMLGDRYDQFQQAFNVEGVAIKPREGDLSHDAGESPAPRPTRPQSTDAEDFDDYDEDSSFLR